MDTQEYISSGIVEQFVLGLCSSEEEQEILRLRKIHPELNAAIFDFELLLEAEGQANAVVPPPAAKAAIFSQIEDSFKDTLPKIVPVQPQEEIPTIPGYNGKKNNWLAYAAAAAFILFLANAVGSIMLYNKYKSVQGAYASLQKENAQVKLQFNSMYADVQRMSNKSTQRIDMAGVAGREESLATVFWNRETSEVYLFKNNLPTPEKGKQYQLWAIVDGQPVDAGMLDADCEGLCKLKSIPNAQAFAITLEKEGGSPTPTMSEMYVLGTT